MSNLPNDEAVVAENQDFNQNKNPDSKSNLDEKKRCY